MAIFKYRAVNKENKTLAGMVEAPNEAMAIDILKEKELEILSLTEKAGKGGGKFNISFGGRVKAKEVVIFSRQFSVLIASGVALVQSLKLLVEQTKNPKLQGIISEIADEIDGGARLSDTLAKHPKVFTNFYINVVRSGESSGKLDEVLEYLADELEKDYDMISKIKGAMIYPVFIITGLSIVGTMMMIFVVPKLTEILQESGTELPLATRVLMGISSFLQNYWYILIIGIVGTVAAIRFFVNLPIGKQIIDNLVLKLPIFGKLFKKIYLVRFTRSLETLIKGGVSISKGLEITAEVVSNDIYRTLINQTKKDVEDGKAMSLAFTQSEAVPNMVGQMISIGEKTGKLDSILASISAFYGREIDNTVANLMTLMEPIIMVVIGIAVGTMVAAIILPMYNMTSSF